MRRSRRRQSATTSRSSTAVRAPKTCAAFCERFVCHENDPSGNCDRHEQANCTEQLLLAGFGGDVKTVNGNE
jgi:hypothetical protein